MKYFAAELSLTELFFREREMATYVHGANGTTIGACYTNAQHADDHHCGHVGGGVTGDGEIYQGKN